MSDDIQPLLDEWDYDPSRLCVRKIVGEDGREKVQLRIEMGILQMDVSERPDGERPHGYGSLLEYYQAQAEEAVPRADGESSFTVDSEMCMELQMEAIQYYHRRISFLELGDYARAKEDAERNLALFDFVSKYGADEDDRLAMEQYRPFVVGHRVRAGALLNLERDDFDCALREIEEGIEEIQVFFRDFGRPDLLGESEEIRFLSEWAEEIRKDRPRSPVQNLAEQLREAVATENFERAAELRDRISDILQQGRDAQETRTVDNVRSRSRA